MQRQNKQAIRPPGRNRRNAMRVGVQDLQGRGIWWRRLSGRWRGQGLPLLLRRRRLLRLLLLLLLLILRLLLLRLLLLLLV